MPIEIDSEVKERFLEKLSETGNVTIARNAVGLTPRRLHLLRDYDKQFAADWDLAFEIGMTSLEAEAVRRAADGVEEPVFYKGEVCGAVTKYSDGLLQFLLKGNMTKYRDRVQADLRTVNITPEQLKNLTTEELEALEKISQKLLGPAAEE